MLSIIKSHTKARFGGRDRAQTCQSTILSAFAACRHLSDAGIPIALARRKNMYGQVHLITHTTLLERLASRNSKSWVYASSLPLRLTQIPGYEDQQEYRRTAATSYELAVPVTVQDLPPYILAIAGSVDAYLSFIDAIPTSNYPTLSKTLGVTAMRAGDLFPHLQSSSCVHDIMPARHADAQVQYTWEPLRGAWSNTDQTV